VVKEILLPDTEITLYAGKSDQGCVLELSSNVLAIDIFLSMEAEGFCPVRQRVLT